MNKFSLDVNNQGEGCGGQKLIQVVERLVRTSEDFKKPKKKA